MEKDDESRAFQIAVVLCVGWAVETPPTADAPGCCLYLPATTWNAPNGVLSRLTHFLP